MKETTNYKFKKRELTDVADITATEDNWDVVDAQIKKNADDLSAHSDESANKAHGGFKGALVRLLTNQSIPNNAYTTVSFETALYDTSSFWDSGLPTRLTIPSGVNKVVLKANVQWDANDTGRREFSLRKNGGSFIGQPDSRNAASQRTNDNMASAVIDVIAGDYFEVVVLQNSGGALNLMPGTPMWFALEVVE